MNPKLKLLAWVAAVAGLGWLLVGCSSTVLPGSSNVSQSTWNTYADAKKAYDTVKVGESSLEDIRKLGFDPKVVPNIKVINYVDVVNLFGPAFKMDDLPGGVQACAKAREDCYAYAVRLQNVQSQRGGFIPADLLGFKKQVTTTGWELNATLVLVGDKVVYKLWNGTPDIKATNQEFNPLGPMQNMSGLIPKPF